jgi:hypothetical protein
MNETTFPDSGKEAKSQNPEEYLSLSYLGQKCNTHPHVFQILSLINQVQSLKIVRNSNNSGVPGNQ